MAKKTWLELDTAPKDGTLIVLWGRTDAVSTRRREITGRWNPEYSCWNTIGGWVILAEKWRP